MEKKCALAGNRTRVNCLEGSYAHHYTTNAYAKVTEIIKVRKTILVQVPAPVLNFVSHINI